MTETYPLRPHFNKSEEGTSSNKKGRLSPSTHSVPASSSIRYFASSLLFLRQEEKKNWEVTSKQVCHEKIKSLYSVKITNRLKNEVLEIKEFGKSKRFWKLFCQKNCPNICRNCQKRPWNSLCKAVKGQMPIFAFMEIGATLLSKWRLEGLPFLSSNKIYKMVGNFRWNSNQRTDHEGKKEKKQRGNLRNVTFGFLSAINFRELK